jgi:hypothetical protein
MSDKVIIPPLRSSHIQAILRSPQHYLEELKSGRDSPALKIGRLFHYLLLECNPTQREDELSKFWKKPPAIDFRTTAGKEWRNSKNPDYQVDTATEWESLQNIRGMIDSVRRDQSIATLLDHPYSRKEFPLAWRDNEFDIPCTGKADLLYLEPLEEGEACEIVDFKTTDDARLDAMIRSVKKYGYHCQAAMYCDAAKAMFSLETEPRYFIVAIEKQPPYAFRKYPLSPMSIAIGREIYRRAAAIYAHCISCNEWPAYTDELIEIELGGSGL